MQEELMTLWDEVRFTLLFVTHSIEEALVVGSRIGVLTPHPGRLRAEINAHEVRLREHRQPGVPGHGAACAPPALRRGARVIAAKSLPPLRPRRNTRCRR